MHRRIVAIAVVFGLFAAAAPAFADDPPWYQGVSKADRERATLLFEQGNQFFATNDYAKAVEIYTRALASWDNPGIRFNLAVSLLNLDRVLEAYEHLTAAMKYGEAGLDAQRIKEAQTYKVLLEGRIVRFEVETTQDNVEVTLDGKILVSGKKGKAALTTLPGAHALVATSRGFEPVTKNLVLVGGTPAHEVITLSPRGTTTRIARRYRTWIPWTILGVGAGTALLGGGTMVLARSHMSQFDADFERDCPSGCPGADLDWSLHDRAKIENAIGIGLVAAGGAAVVTGLIAVFRNQPREVPVDNSVVVNASAHGAGIAWLGRF